MIKLGDYNRLKVIKLVDFGAYLDGGNGLEILIPAKYLSTPVAIGDEIDVFVYKDAENRLIATTEHPLATVNTVAFLQVKDVNRVGAFMDWGVLKELLVPYSEQKIKMHIGGIYPVYVYLDHASQRIVGSAKIEKYIGNKLPDLHRNDKVNALVYKHIGPGYRMIVNNLYFGMLYDNEIFRPLTEGDRVVAYVKNIRPDGKIDLTLSPKNIERVKTLSDNIMDALDRAGGVLDISDHSTPDRIKEMFECSKKDFKKAIGALYKQHIIEIYPDRIVKTGAKHD